MQPIDWDDALDNRGYIADIEDRIRRLAEDAQAFRAERMASGEAALGLAYGPHPRERVDLFRPHGAVAGLLVFVHGGYWRSFDRTDWSHMAASALGRGWAVAVPGYTLCPEATVPGIARQVALAVEHVAALVKGPIRLVGHSAGGQVVTRLVAGRPLLAPDLLRRVAGVVSISGVHDLVPLLGTLINDDLRLDQKAALAESPARLPPPQGIPVTAWVGGDERPEFLRQSALLRQHWGARLVVEPDRHHFDVVDGLAEGGALLDAALGETPAARSAAS